MVNHKGILLVLCITPTSVKLALYSTEQLQELIIDASHSWIWTKMMAFNRGDMDVIYPMRFL